MVSDIKNPLCGYGLGKVTQILLVIPMRQPAALITALLCALLHTCPAHAGIVTATDYSSFWIWGGVKPQPVLSRAENLYILQGQVIERKRHNRDDVMVVAQGMPVARIKKSRIWLVYRADTLRWTPDIMPAIILRLKQWQLSGNPVVGLEIDFDAKTRYLQEYVTFLKQIRTQLPAEYRLGITGLLDWSSTGDINAINQLQDVIDEITVQTYQGRRTITNYAAYLPALARLTLPFKIGLIQNGEWLAPEGLEANPWFQGYVVFLQNKDSALGRGLKQDYDGVRPAP
jgi:hypothetical protein